MKTTEKKNNFCVYAKKCSGCQLCNLEYSEQLKMKQAKTGRLLSSFCSVQKIHSMEQPVRYRNKIQRAFSRAADGSLTLGIFQSATGHVIPVDDCNTENENANEICETVLKLAKSYKLKAYDYENDTGLLRHILIRTADGTGEIMVVIVTADKVFPKLNQFTNALVKKHPEIVSVVRNIYTDEMPLVLGEKQEVLFGDGYIEDELCSMRFRISPKSFYQINRTQTEWLYSKALELADISENQLVFDAYCGTGTIGIIASKKAGRVIGAEINSDAVKDAEFNAKLNERENISFICADAVEALEKCKEKIDVLIMDPPRQGSSRQFINAVIKAKPQKIVYVSCNPETLRRDLYNIMNGGYKVKKIQPVDLFPYTKHVESICLLEKVKNYTIKNNIG